MLEINASKIVNTVTFTVDKSSIAQAKKAADDLHKHFEKIANPKIRFKTQKQNKQKARQIADDSKFNTNAKNTAEMKAQRLAEKQQKQQEREAQRLAKRHETADLKLRSAHLQMKGIAGKYGVDPAAQHQFAKFAHEQTELFRNGQISSQKLNYELRERIALLRRESAVQAKITASAQAQQKATAKDYKGAEKRLKGGAGSNLLLGGGGAILSGAVLASGGAAALGRIRDKGNDNLDLVRKSAAVKVNPNAVKALVAYNRQHGIDSNYDTITDNFKDVRERLGESVSNSQFDSKSGKWKGGNGAVDNILNQFGWTKDDIAKYQDNPLDFPGAVVNEGQRRGMSDASIGHLLEDLGNDMSYLVPALKNGGEELNKTLKQLTDSGQTLNDEQIKQVYEYGDLTVAMGSLMNGFDNNLFNGFMHSFSDGADDLIKNQKTINSTAELLGESLGNLSKNVTSLIGDISGVVSDLNEGLRSRFPEWFSDANKPAAQSLYDGAVGGSANATADWIQDKTGFNTRSVGPAIAEWLGINQGSTGEAYSRYNINGDSIAANAGAMPLGTSQAMQYQVNPVFNLTVAPSLPLTIQSDTSGLSDYISFQAKASQESFTQALTLSVSSGQSAGG
ncbi:MAG TPA: hypothetical protein VGI71_12090 [Scandinavium sp.]|jgi:hypothetical protein